MLLSKNDSLPFKVYNETCDTPVLLVCDHAGNEIPENLKRLGLSREVLETHIAIDLGCRDLAIALSDLMKSTLIIASYSRLTIDLNRSPYDETLITQISDDIEIPGNQNLSKYDISQFTIVSRISQNTLTALYVILARFKGHSYATQTTVSLMTYRCPNSLATRLLRIMPF